MSSEMNYSCRYNSTSSKRLRTVICCILSFLLSISLTLLTLLLVIEWSGLSRSSFSKNMSANKYYDHVKEDIYDEAEAITIPTGLPDEVLTDIITTDKISQDVNGYINASFNEKIYRPDTKDITRKLRRNIETFLQKEGIDATKEQNRNINTYIASVEEIYIDTVKVPFLSLFEKARIIYNKIFLIGLAGGLLFSMICIYMIIKLHRWIHKAFRFIVYSTIATGLMTGILPTYIITSGFYKKINLSPEYFYNFIVDYITNILKAFIYFSTVWLVISLLIIAIIGIMRTTARTVGIRKKIA